MKTDMRFCVLNSERHGTCYHELYKGEWDSDSLEFWSDDSLYIHDDTFNRYPKLQKTINLIIPTYDMYNATAVTKASWEEMGKLIAECDQDTKDFYAEIDEWAKPVLKEYGLFTILGI